MRDRAILLRSQCDLLLQSSSPNAEAVSGELYLAVDVCILIEPNLDIVVTHAFIVQAVSHDSLLSF